MSRLPMKWSNIWITVLTASLALLVLENCRREARVLPPPSRPPARETTPAVPTPKLSRDNRPAQPMQPAVAQYLERTGFSIQVGAFASVDNAAHLTADLQRQGVDAYYFLYKTGLYKVRFGDFASKEIARAKAEKIKATGVIGVYYIVSPEMYSVAQAQKRGEQYVRDRIVATAISYLGLPYQWGGASQATGFDCSGLAMAVYQLNGLNLPRTSENQFHAGTPVEYHPDDSRGGKGIKSNASQKNTLRKGDLVFFAARPGGRVSHVGIYTGSDNFIHAPNSGQPIRTDSLENRYYQQRLLGARSYLK